MVEHVVHEPIRGVEIVAQRVLTRIIKNLRLSIADTTMGAMAVHQLRSETFAPSVKAGMSVQAELPEDIRGTVVARAV